MQIKVRGRDENRKGCAYKLESVIFLCSSSRPQVVILVLISFEIL